MSRIVSVFRYLRCDLAFLQTRPVVLVASFQLSNANLMTPINRSKLSKLVARSRGFVLILFGLAVVVTLWRVQRSTPDGPAGEVAGASIDLEFVSKLPRRTHRSSSSPKAAGDDAHARMQYEFLRLRDPRTGTVPPDIRSKELAFAATLPRVEELRAGKNSAGVEQWNLRGPVNVGGRTRALAIDLDFNGSSNRRILAGGATGGMYLSEDDGQTWSLVTSLGDHSSVTAIKQDPGNRNTWYYGTGEASGSAGVPAASYNGIGVFKSTNRGASWTHLPSTQTGNHHEFDDVFDNVWNLAIHPTDGTVYVSVYGLILRSTDGGTSWTGVLGSGPPFSTITDVHVANDGDVYAALSRNGSGKTEYGIFRSSTGAAGSFQDISPPGLANDPWRIVINTGASDPSTLYAFVQINQSGSKSTDHQLFRYDEGSNSWTDLSAGLPNETGVDGNASMTTQGGYDQIVVVSPTNSNVMYIGGTNLYRSSNGGQSFTRVGGYSEPTSYNQYPGHHSDQHALVFYPNNPTVALSGSDGGVSKASDIVNGQPTWTFMNAGYVTSQFYGVGVDPVAGSTTVIGGLQDNGTWGTQDTDGQAAWFQLQSGDGGYSYVTPGANELFVAVQNGVVYRITQSNYTFISPAGAQQYQFITPYQPDPNNPTVVYIAEAGGVWRNSDVSAIPEGNGDPTSINWSFMSGSAQAGHFTTMLAVPNAPSNRIYFGTTDFSSTTTLLRVDNASGNGSATSIMPPITTGGIPPFAADVAANPDNGDEIVAVFSNYGIESIWHSTNAGGSWTNISGNVGGVNGPSIRSAVIVPTNSGNVFMVGTSTGVYSTNNLNGASTTWALEGGSVLGNVVVGQLSHRFSDGTVTAGTHGRGVYQAKVSGGGSTGSAQASASKSSLGIEVIGAGNSGSTTFQLTNSGGATLNYSISATSSAASNVTASIQVADPPLAEYRDADGRGEYATKVLLDTRDVSADRWRRLARERRAGPASSTASSTQSLRAHDARFLRSNSGDILALDDGNDTADQYVGFGDGFTAFQWLNRFTTPTGGFQLESVFVNMRTEQVALSSLFLIITDPSGNEFTSGSVSLEASPAGKWYEIGFNPIQLPAGQVFDVEFIAHSSIGFPAGADFNGLVTGSSFFYDGFSYTSLATQPNFANGAFLIRAQGTGAQAVNNPPTAHIQTSKTTADVGESITFNGTGSTDSDGTIVGYAWDFGDGGTASQATTQHSYTTAGTYTASLTVTDDKGATNATSVGITVVSNVPSRLAASPNSGTLGAGQSQTITVTYDGSGLGFGVYNGTVTVNTNGGNLTLPVTIGVTNVGISEEAADEIADAGGIMLRSNYPNPFTASTTIPYTMPMSGHVLVDVYDVRGRIVRRLVNEQRSGGDHEVTWDARDDSGARIASGIYFVQMEATTDDGTVIERQSRKITVRK